MHPLLSSLRPCCESIGDCDSSDFLPDLITFANVSSRNAIRSRCCSSTSQFVGDVSTPRTLDICCRARSLSPMVHPHSFCLSLCLSLPLASFTCSVHLSISPTLYTVSLSLAHTHNTLFVFLSLALFITFSRTHSRPRPLSIASLCHILLTPAASTPLGTTRTTHSRPNTATRWRTPPSPSTHHRHTTTW